MIEFAESGTVTIEVDYCARRAYGQVDAVPEHLSATFFGHIEIDRSDGAFAWCDD